MEKYTAEYMLPIKPLKYPYTKTNIKIPEREFEDYIFSPDGSFLAAINDRHGFVLYEAEDLATGQFRPFYQYKESVHESVQAQTAVFAEFGPTALFPDEISTKLKQTRQVNTILSYNYFLIVAAINEANLYVFNLSRLRFEARIGVTAPILSMKIDKIIPTIIYYIEKRYYRLIKFDLQLRKKEIIAEDVKSFEELEDGSLIIRTKKDFKFYNQKTKSFTIKGMIPKAFFSIGYQKVLLIGYLANQKDSPYRSPCFMIFNPYSVKTEPIYPLPYFSFSPEDENAPHQQFYCSSFSGPQRNPDVPNRGTSVYVASSHSNYIVHITSEGEFYHVDSADIIEFPIKCLRRFDHHGEVLAILGKGDMTLFTFDNPIAQGKNQLSKRIAITDTKRIDDPQLERKRKLLLRLPKPSNVLQTVTDVTKEVDEVVDSFNVYGQVLKEQAYTSHLIAIVKSKKPWDPHDHDFYKNKIEKEQEILRQNLNGFEKKLHPAKEEKISYQFRYSPTGYSFTKEDLNKK